MKILFFLLSGLILPKVCACPPNSEQNQHQTPDEIYNSYSFATLTYLPAGKRRKTPTLVMYKIKKKRAVNSRKLKLIKNPASTWPQGNKLFSK